MLDKFIVLKKQRSFRVRSTHHLSKSHIDLNNWNHYSESDNRYNLIQSDEIAKKRGM